MSLNPFKHTGQQIFQAVTTIAAPEASRMGIALAQWESLPPVVQAVYERIAAWIDAEAERAIEAVVNQMLEDGDKEAA